MTGNMRNYFWVAKGEFYNNVMETIKKTARKLMQSSYCGKHDLVQLQIHSLQ